MHHINTVHCGLASISSPVDDLKDIISFFKLLDLTDSDNIIECLKNIINNTEKNIDILNHFRQTDLKRNKVSKQVLADQTHIYNLQIDIYDIVLEIITKQKNAIQEAYENFSNSTYNESVIIVNSEDLESSVQKINQNDQSENGQDKKSTIGKEEEGEEEEELYDVIEIDYGNEQPDKVTPENDNNGVLELVVASGDGCNKETYTIQDCSINSLKVERPPHKRKKKNEENALQIGPRLPSLWVVPVRKLFWRG